MCCQAAKHCHIQRLQDVHRLGRQGQDDYIGSSCQLDYSQTNVPAVIVHYEMLCLIMSSMSQETIPEPKKKQLLENGPFTAGAVKRAGGPFGTSDVERRFLLKCAVGACLSHRH